MQNKFEFISKVEQGLEDIKNNRVHSLQETFEAIEKILRAAENNKRYSSSEN